MRLKVRSMAGVVIMFVLLCMTTGAAFGRAQAQTIVRVVPGEVTPDRHVTVSIEANFLGIENSFGASLEYNPEEFSFVGFKNPFAYPSAVFFINPLRVSEGKLGFLYGLPAGRVFPAGAGKVLSFEFVVLRPGKLTINFGDAPVIREIVDVRAQVVPSDFQSGVIETPLPSLAFFYVGPTRGTGSAWVLFGGFEGAEKLVVMAFTDINAIAEEGRVVGEILPGQWGKFECAVQSGITYFRVVPMSGGQPWGEIPGTIAVMRQ